MLSKINILQSGLKVVLQREQSAPGPMAGEVTLSYINWQGHSSGHKEFA